MNLQGIPHKLYKYFSLERSDVISLRSFRYTPLGQFNDPFEGKPHIGGLTSDETALSMYEECLPSELEKTYLELPAQARSQMSKEQFIELMLPAMRDKKGTLLKMLGSQADAIIASMPQQLDQSMGALCLSEVCDSLLMWAHYGSSHNGFVVEFNSHHPYFHQQQSDQDELRHIRRVLYRDARPSAMLTDLEGSDVFLIKSSHWAYEREWRIFMPLSAADKIVELPTGKLYLYQIPPEAISGIIFGARTTSEFRNSIQDLVSQSPELTHIRLKTCFTDSKEFAIRMRDGVI